MTRDNFEILSTKDKKKYIVKQIKAFYDIKRKNEVYNCEINGCDGVDWLQTHHIWYRSQSPLWYHSLHENMIIICGKCHGDIHDRGRIIPELEAIKAKLKQEDKEYKEKDVYDSSRRTS